VHFEAPAQRLEDFVGRWAEVERTGESSCVMTMNTETLDWPMMVLANIDAEFRIEQPAELIDRAAGAAERFSRATG
jgi:predicted DNA-binding transcriptional regulator YafY